MNEKEVAKLLKYIRSICKAKYTGKIEIDTKNGGDFYVGLHPQKIKIKEADLTNAKKSIINLSVTE